MAPVITSAPSEENIPQYSATSEEIPLGEYLFLRICQASPKIRSVFGIPGDFNLALLEHLYTASVAEKVEFVGFCNELNAAYAADGYAKVIEDLSVLITTYGVGELSATNGIAGAFAEYAPVLHIVGTTSTKQSDQAQSVAPQDVRNIHHLVQNKNALAAPNHDVYKSIVDGFSVVQESLDHNVLSNLDKIDNVLITILHEKRPGYIYIPSDIPDITVPKARLAQPLDLSELNNEALLAEVSLTILNKLYASTSPSILGGALTDRFGAQNAFTSFVEAMPSNFVKLFSTALGRNIDEGLPNYIGIYAGKLSSDPEVNVAIENETDFLLSLGHLNNEINTGVYTTDLSRVSNYVEVHPDYVLIDGEYIIVKDAKTGKRLFSIVDLMESLAANFEPERLEHNDGETHIRTKPELRQLSLTDDVPAEVLTQNKLIDFFNSYLRPNDILIVETCSFLFGVSDIRFPRGVRFFSQNFYGSIGYALPATFGVSRAERDLGTNRRVVLVQGDGSAQMTIQELSTFLRYETQAPEIFLLNNEGYTVERVIKGPTRSYNDIQDTWDWTELFKIFGDKKGEKHVAEKINTTSDLESLVGHKASAKIRFYELKLAKLDVPQRLITLVGKRSS
ncbi:pyruvate decarboxylase [Metschnikowia bicuspidata var. bicuspidata NRRL YB-4993]|uniref:Pyruvate decarboxylase n=1 Tax=Metschnikowia bicuspidata var. bicuspidata NRRL YB-4993 TaxID=869754 RepID=A0A1A0HDS7_9ASCO|nr:pyruvate decarboxylase [Metschnikowia bicuspidata var. bicuspidata NRRL YB-4993]OBA22078.1 pyruvate decarboxylase [Metschnikowia bicuspidata var. bicuspidata NRRL YB-4993]